MVLRLAGIEKTTEACRETSYSLKRASICGVGWYAGPWPLLQCSHERLARRLLGDVDVTEAPDQHGHRATVLLAEYNFDLWDGWAGG